MGGVDYDELIPGRKLVPYIVAPLKPSPTHVLVETFTIVLVLNLDISTLSPSQESPSKHRGRLVAILIDVTDTSSSALGACSCLSSTGSCFTGRLGLSATRIMQGLDEVIYAVADNLSGPCDRI
jgi:hypothetical protein